MLRMHLQFRQCSTHWYILHAPQFANAEDSATNNLQNLQHKQRIIPDCPISVHILKVSFMPILAKHFGFDRKQAEK